MIMHLLVFSFEHAFHLQESLLPIWSRCTCQYRVLAMLPLATLGRFSSSCVPRLAVHGREQNQSMCCPHAAVRSGTLHPVFDVIVLGTINGIFQPIVKVQGPLHDQQFSLEQYQKERTSWRVMPVICILTGEYIQ